MFNEIGEWLAAGQGIYFFIAVAGTTVFVVQFILTVIGLHSDTDMPDSGFEVDSHDVTDISGLNFFSLKSIVAFITFFGWGGVFFGHLGWGGLAIACFCGAAMMALTAIVLSLLLKMQQSGNISPEDMLNHRATVYLSIPPGRAPGGIVTVALENCSRQVHARSDKAIPTGTDVIVSENLGGGAFLVRPVDKNDSNNKQ
ncbi:MAG: hypothetical protein PHI35_05325 [Victivallaceae bacterium]|nr:hypothetical protein [Victivallaceae bacterium]